MICINLPIRYPPDVFPGPWTFLEGLFLAGGAILPSEILKETGKGTNTFPTWFNDLGAKATYLSSYNHDDPESALVRVLTRCRIDKPKGNDHILVATSVELQDEGRTPVVVSDEKTSKGALPLKVPDMCKVFDIRCLKFFDFLRENGQRY